MSEVQETGTSRKIEHIEKSQSSSSKTRKLYVLGVAFVAVLLIGTSFGMMLSATTPSIPTVIEPGSNVVGASYVVFKDGSNYYARNGTTGAIDYSSTNALTVLNSSIQHSGNGGRILLQTGVFDFLGVTLTIDTFGITLQGSGYHPRGFQDHNQCDTTTEDTELIGDIILQVPNIQLKDLTINGHLTITSKADKTAAAQNINLERLAIKNGISWIGLNGANSMEIPFATTIDFSYIEISAPGNVLTFQNSGTSPGNGNIDHVYITNSIIDQEYNGDMIKFQAGIGGFTNIAFQNTLLMVYAESRILNFSQTAPGGRLDAVKFIGCSFELGHTGITVFKFNQPFSGMIDVQVIGGIMFTSSPSTTILMYSDDDLNSPYGKLSFIGVRFDNLNVLHLNNKVSIYQRVTTTIALYFINCYFPWAVTFVQDGTCQAIGIFQNCQGINPRGLMTTPIKTESIGLLGTSNTWVASTNYTVGDFPIAITVTGGTGVSINIYDSNNAFGVGDLVLSGATNLTRMYLPIGYKINLGAFSVAPTITVEGL